ncbi:hypothetical protein K3495_g650 [Podosphaera aphanis]|nr:hypothetical protein K3495_g650 [Podosphaera aphanis]
MAITDGGAGILGYNNSRASQRHQRPGAMFRHKPPQHQVSRPRHHSHAITEPDVLVDAPDHPTHNHRDTSHTPGLDISGQRRHQPSHTQDCEPHDCLSRQAAAHYSPGANPDPWIPESTPLSSGNSISGNTLLTYGSENFGQPPSVMFPDVSSDRHPYLVYLTRLVAPVLLALLFTGFGTSVLIYTFTLERALPKRLTAVASISLVSVLTIWGLLRVIEYCVWRREVRRWDPTLTLDDPRASDWESRDQYEDPLPVILKPPRAWSGSSRHDLVPRSTGLVGLSPYVDNETPREHIRRRGAGKFWFSTFHHRGRVSASTLPRARATTASSWTDAGSRMRYTRPESSRDSCGSTALYQCDEGPHENTVSPGVGPRHDNSRQPWGAGPHDADAAHHRQPVPDDVIAVADSLDAAQRGNTISHPRSTRTLVKPIQHAKLAVRSRAA